MESIQEAYQKLVDKDALAYIIKHNGLLMRADRELRLAGYDPSSSDGLSAAMYWQVMKNLAVSASHSNSGFSASVEKTLSYRLWTGTVLSPLMFTDDEWGAYENGKCQNIRDTSVFKDENGDIYDIDAFVKKPLWRKEYGSKKFTTHSEAPCYHGGLYEYDTYYSQINGRVDDGVQKFTGRYLVRANFTKEDVTNGVLPYRPIIVHCAEIEVEPDNWFMMVNCTSDDIVAVEKQYDLVWKEINCLKGVECFKATPELLKKAEKELKGE